MIGEIMIAAMVAFSAPADVVEQAPAGDMQTETIWVTEYCPACNSPAGHGSATGKYLEAGDCACGWLPMGTEITIDGETYTVVDVCGTDAVDLFADDDSGVCVCDRSEYVEAVITRP